MGRRQRAFTMIELIVIVSMVGIVTAMAMTQVSEQIRLARFRAERTRLYLEVRTVRDRSARSLSSWRITPTPASQQLVVEQVSSCLAAAPTVLAAAPAVDFDVLAIGGAALCFNEGGNAATAATLTATGPTGAAADVLSASADGRLTDSWGEFPPEGAFEAGRCDPDVDPTCGR
jgi:type II secretory pathway pseudopilin PulG